MNYPRLSLSVILAFVFVFVFDLFFHGIVLKSAYMETAATWRPQEELIQLIPLGIAAQFTYALLAVVLFAAFCPQSGPANGLRFGILLGALLGTLQFSMYANIPMPLDLASAWFGTMFAETVVIGILTGLVYKGPKP